LPTHTGTSFRERAVKKILVTLLLSFASIAFAEQVPAEASISNAEKAFIDRIQGFEKAQILQEFGEPSKVEDLKANDEKVVASIWQYHYLNTDANGEYYQTTELDFLDDKVIMVVFMNNDGSEVPQNAVSVPIPKKN
jgi:hypothetical protein